MSRKETAGPLHMNDTLVQRAAEAVQRADALLFTAGAGMGVDSGLPDFRGTAGFWRAYPLYQHLRLDFAEMANPRWFKDDPAFAWGFYGHRLNLYRETAPHAGFGVLRKLAARAPRGAFVFTSNVDGQFQRAGFTEPHVAECHGSIHHLQCFAGCGQPLFPVGRTRVSVDPATLRAQGPLPACPACGGLARPNILMFSDYAWDAARQEAQQARLNSFIAAARGPICVIECGAGLAIPTVRIFSEQAAQGGTLIRINIREPQVPASHIGLSSGASAALRALADALGIEEEAKKP